MTDGDTVLEGQTEAGLAPQFPDEDKLEATRRIAYCLSMDMVGSTEQGLSLTSLEFARFNKALVRQIVPHIEGVGLDHALLKFTGDGWLVVTHDSDKVGSLCCLAKIMATRFRGEIASLSNLAPKKIPSLRVALGGGHDLHVRLPNGQLDYVGDSARRATRSMGWCETHHDPAEVLICQEIRSAVDRDFEGTSEDIRNTRKPPKKWEEDFPLYVLGTLRAELLGDADISDCYAYAFAALGRTQEASLVLHGAAQAAQAKLPPPGLDSDTVVHRWNRLLAGVASYTEAERVFGEMRESGSVPDVYSHSILMAKAPSYEQAEQWLKAMEKAGVAPNVVSYSTLISKAPSYAEAERWLKAMEETGVAPDVVSYNTLISKAASYEQAEQWFKAMERAGVAPNVVSYSTLMAKAPSYAEAEGWLKAMEGAGVAPDVVSYTMLISKAPSYAEAEQWLKAMEEAGVAPDVVSYTALISKASSREQGWDVFQRMISDGVRPNERTYTALRRKGITREDAEKVVRGGEG